MFMYCKWIVSVQPADSNDERTNHRLLDMKAPAMFGASGSASAQQSCSYRCLMLIWIYIRYLKKNKTKKNCLFQVEVHSQQTDRQTCLSVWTRSVFVSEPPWAASTDLHQDLCSVITCIPSLSPSLPPSSLPISSSCVSDWTQAVLILFLIPEMLFSYLQIKKKKVCSLNFFLWHSGLTSRMGVLWEIGRSLNKLFIYSN